MATEKRVVEGDLYYSIDGKLTEIKRQLREKDGYPYDPHILDKQLQRVVEGKFHDFNPTISKWTIPPEQQFEIVIGRNFVRTWGFKEEDLEKTYQEMSSIAISNKSHPFSSFRAIVLDVVLDSTEETVSEAWHYLKQTYNKIYTHEEFDPHSVFYPADMPRLKKGLYWQVIDFSANRGVRPDSLKNGVWPSSAILWAATYFPCWIKAMDGQEVPYILIPGYRYDLKAKYETPDYRSGTKILGLSCRKDDVNFLAGNMYYSSHAWAIPEYVF